MQEPRLSSCSVRASARMARLPPRAPTEPHGPYALMHAACSAAARARRAPRRRGGQAALAPAARIGPPGDRRMQGRAASLGRGRQPARPAAPAPRPPVRPARAAAAQAPWAGRRWPRPQPRPPGPRAGRPPPPPPPAAAGAARPRNPGTPRTRGPDQCLDAGSTAPLPQPALTTCRAGAPVASAHRITGNHFEAPCHSALGSRRRTTPMPQRHLKRKRRACIAPTSACSCSARACATARPNLLAETVCCSSAAGQHAQRALQQKNL